MVAHVVVAALLLGSRVEKTAPAVDEPRVTFFSPPPPPPAQAAAAAPTPKHHAPKSRRTPKAHRLVEPSPDPKPIEKEAPKPEEPAPSADTGPQEGASGGAATGAEGGAPGGAEGGEAGGVPGGTGHGHAKPKNVPAFVIQRDMINQSPIRLSEIFKRSHRGQPIAGVFKVCVGLDGHVYQVSTVKSVPGADEDISSGIKDGWVYKAQQVPVCFLYNIHVTVQ
jgi:protein TonB